MNKTLKIIGVSLLVLMVAAYIVIDFAAEKFVKEQLDKFSASNKQLGTLEYSDVDFSLLKLQLRINDIKATPNNAKYPIQVDSLILKNFKTGATDVPEELALYAKGLHIDAVALGPQGSQLLELGYNTLLADIGIDYHYNSETKELKINELSYGAKDLGEVEMKLHLYDFDLSNLNLFSALGRIPQINVQSASFIYDDDSFFERTVKAAATQERMKPSDIIAEAAAKIDIELAKAKNDFSRQVLMTLQQFIKDPKIISISAHPVEPVSIGTIQATDDPHDLLKLLNVKVSL